MFPRLEYLEWISGRPEVALYDLGTSDLHGDRDHDPVVVPEPLEDLPDPPTGATLETQLASEYGVDPENVLVTAGASTANVAATAAAIYPDPDEDVAPDWQPTALVEKPGYEPLVKTPAALGATVDRFHRGDDYRLDLERATNAVTDDTRVVTVTNRHNPSGRLADRDTLTDLAARANDSGARLLVDEVYAPFGTEPVDGAFGGPTVAGVGNVAVTGSLTKFHGLGDLRVGWLVADEPFVERARSVAFHVPGMSGPGRALGTRALHNLDALGERARDLVAANHDLLAEFVATRDDVDGFVPDGSTFAFLDPANATGDELTTAAWDEGVLVVPGRFFDDPERVRVSLGRSPDHTAAALDALGTILDGVQ